jgi:hypothetical protein
MTMMFRRVVPGAVVIALVTAAACRRAAPAAAHLYPTPEGAVQALLEAATAEKVDAVVALFGTEGKSLVDTTDPASARRSREVFLAAAKEQWSLADGDAGGKVLVVGNEQWPFPVPLIREAGGWRFDTAAGTEELMARRVGRNELSAIDTCETYVYAQHLYARDAHDGKPSGVYAAAIRSDPGKENGLYWPPARGRKRSPLGDLLANAADQAKLKATDSQRPPPFHGYYFRVLTAQGPAATGGEKDYIVKGEMTGGFALLAWPAQYDVTGVMTFLVSEDGVVRQKDLGPDTDAAARAIARYDPDPSWVPAR